MSSPSDAGLQAERTVLSWSRTALGLAGNALLIGLRDLGRGPVTLTAVPAVLALLVALATALYGRRRGAQLRRAPLPDPLAPRRAVTLLGGAVVVLAVVSGVVLVTSSL